ncbi:MAG: DNA-binding protein [Methylobacter sp.]
MRKTEQVKTPDQVKAEFTAKGITISQWAREHNWKPREVSLVLNGQVKGNYGKGHDIAVALGLKPAPESDPEPELAAA